MTTVKTDKVAQIVTDRIIKELERIIETGKGDAPWRRPWKITHFVDGTSCYGAINATSCKPYRGINQLILGFSPDGDQDRLWYLTLNQIKKLGLRVKHDEYRKSIPVLFWGRRKGKKDVENPTTGEVQEKDVWYWFKKFYSVYHWTQIDATEKEIMAKLPIAKKVKKAKKAKDEGKITFATIQAAEDMIKNMPKVPKIVEKGTRACYYPTTDIIEITNRNNFESPNAFYEVLFHELVHSTGHQDRLNRKSLTELCGFGSHEYSKEELVAEIGSNMIMSLLGIDRPELNTNAVAYCRSWLKRLKDDVTFAIDAAAKAQKAMDFIANAKAAGVETDAEPAGIEEMDKAA